MDRRTRWFLYTPKTFAGAIKKNLPSTLTCTVQWALFPEESVAVIRAVFTVPMSATVSRSTPVSEDVLDPCSTLLTKSRGSRVTMVVSSGMRTVLDGLQDSIGGISSVTPTANRKWTMTGLQEVYKKLYLIFIKTAPGDILPFIF